MRCGTRPSRTKRRRQRPKVLSGLASPSLIALANICVREVAAIRAFEAWVDGRCWSPAVKKAAHRHEVRGTIKVICEAWRAGWDAAERSR